MRVLFTTYPEKTHFQLLVPLAWALRTAGHEVCFAVQPKFVDIVTQAGLTAVPIGNDRDVWRIVGRVRDWIGDEATEGQLYAPYDSALMRPEEVTWEHVRDGFRQVVERLHKPANFPIISGLVEFARQWRPDLVLWEANTFAGGIAARACGAAHGRLVFAIDVEAIARDLFLGLREEQPEDERVDPMGDWLAGYARKYGFDFSEDLVTGQFTVDQLPETLGMRSEHLDYLPVRPVPYGGPAVVPKWLQELPKRPRVALTLGLSTTDHDADYSVDVQDVLDAIADLDIDVVATIAESQQANLARVPDNTRVVSYVPLLALVPTCDAVIHHGGYGTLSTVALNGVPQLVLPGADDGPVLGRRVADIGAGLSADPRRTTGSEVREYLLRLLDGTGFEGGVARLRSQMAALPSPNELVPRLEAAAVQHRASSRDR